MATTVTPIEDSSSSKALKCKRWVLKVSIHCQGCKRKVKKVLLAIDGVYTATIDSQQHRVTVIGNIEVETLIKRLIIKTGKHAEIWPEKIPSKEQGASSEQPNNTQKKNDSKSNQDSSKKKAVKISGGDGETKDVGKSPENTTVSEELPPEEGVSLGAKSRGNRNKKKGQIRENQNSNSHSTSAASTSSDKAANTTAFQTYGMGMNQATGPSNLNPTRHHQSGPFHPPQGYNFPPAAYASNYRMATYPREYSYPGTFIYAPVSPYPRVTPLDSFSYFSDENAHACSIM